MRSSLKRALRTLWPLLAGVVLLVAGVSVALRLALPGLDQHRPEIEATVARLTGTPVSIGRIGASWQGLWPRLTLEDLRIAPQPEGGAALSIAAVEVTLGLRQSLQAGEPVLEQLRLSGLALTVVRQADGRFQIAGLPATRTPLLSWLLRQQAIAVEDLTLQLRDQQGKGPPQHFTGLRLRLSQSGSSTVLRGQAPLPGPQGQTADAELRWSNGGPSPTMELRLALNALPLGAIAEWLAQPQLTQVFSSLTGRSWWHWEAGRLRRVAVQARLAQARADLPSLALRGVAERAADGWRLQLDQLALGSSAQRAPEAPMLATLTPAGDETRLILSAARLPLDLLSLLPATTLPVLRPAGELHDLRAGLSLARERPPRFYLAGQLRHGDWQATGRLPGIDGLSAGFALNQRGGALALRQAAFHITQPEHLLEPLRVRDLDGRLRLTREANGWHLASGGIDGMVQALPLHVAGDVHLRPAARPQLDLQVLLGPGELDQLPSLLPQGLLHPRGDHWFRTAFGGGRLEQVEVDLHGDLARFPFDDGGGSFVARFAVSDTRMQYSPKWPAIPDAAGHGVVVGRQLHATITRSRFAEAPADDVILRVADLYSHDPVLLIDGRVHATLPDARTVLAASPLTALAERLSIIELDEPFDLTLALRIGLRHGSKHTVNGQIDLDGNRLRSQREGLTLSDLRGQIGFANHAWSGAGLTANLEGAPVTLAVQGGQRPGDDAIALQLDGAADPPQIARYLEKYVPGVHRWLADSDRLRDLHGSTAWQARLQIPPAQAGAPPPVRQLQIESTLSGLAVDLPWPFAKTAAETLPLSIDTTLGDPAVHLTRLQFGERLQIGVRHGGSDPRNRLQALDVALGGAPLDDASAGIRFHGKVARLATAEWRSLVSHAASLGADGELPLRFAVDLAQLDTLGQRFEAVKLSGARDTSHWSAQIENTRVAGQISLPRKPGDGPIALTLDRLWLDRPAPEGQPETIDPRALPALSLRCADFRYGEIQFGQAAFETHRQPEGLHLESLTFRQPAFDVTASGDWTLRDAAHSSQFRIDVRGPALGGLLAAFGYAVAAIEGGPTTLGITAGWPGMPSSFTLQSLTGSLALKVGEGRLLDIEPGSGRLFGLLSLQTLPRRLTLDFSDLFDKGFAFDRIEGEFQLEQGNAYTNRLAMDGPAAHIEIAGRTGLGAQDYDQRATVTPALSSSLPLAGALFGPAGIGVGAALYLGQQVLPEIPRQVDRLLSREYRITGSWQDPHIEKQ